MPRIRPDVIANKLYVMSVNLVWKKEKPFNTFNKLWSKPLSIAFNDEWWAVATFSLHTSVFNKTKGERTVLSCEDAREQFDHDRDHQITALFQRNNRLMALSSRGYLYVYAKTGWKLFKDEIMDSEVSGKILFQQVAYDPNKDRIFAYGGTLYGNRQTRVRSAYVFDFATSKWSLINGNKIFAIDYEYMQMTKESITFNTIYVPSKESFLVVGKNESWWYDAQWETAKHRVIPQGYVRLVFHCDSNNMNILIDLRVYDKETEKEIIRVYQLDFPKIKVLAHVDLPPRASNIVNTNNFFFEATNGILHYQNGKDHYSINLSPILG